MCNKQKELTDYFQSSQSPKSKLQCNLQSTSDISGNIMLVDSLSNAGGAFDIQSIQLDNMSVDTSLASVAASALFKNDVLQPDLTSTPKHK